MEHLSTKKSEKKSENTKINKKLCIFDFGFLFDGIDVKTEKTEKIKKLFVKG